MASLKNFGLMLEPQEGMKVSELLKWGSYAERSGYGYLFRSDHLLPTSGRRGIDSPECWTTLAALAVKTKTIKFGPMVSPIGFRNPALLAKMACTVYSLSKGRLALSVGAGWYKDEYDAFGLGFPKFRMRKEQLEEALSIIVPLIRGKRVDFDGKHFSAHTDCLPKPDGRMHLIVGGRSAATVRVAARIGDEWNTVHPSRESFSSLKKIVNATGRRLQISMMGPFLLGDDRADLESKMKSRMRASGASGDPSLEIARLRKLGLIVGTPREFADQIKERQDWGIQKFYLQIADPASKASVGLLTETLRRA